MARFSELGVVSDVVVGKSIDIEDLFGKRILIEKTIIQPTKYPGKNASGLRMQMQVILTTFDDDGNYGLNVDGTPIGERRSCFTGSDVLISAIQKAEMNLPEINQKRAELGQAPLVLYPMETTIVKVGKCFQFT